MKENKLLGKDSKSEEEKTKVELFEEEVKSSIFSVYYLLLKNQETTFWKFIVLLVVEYIQLLSFSFDESVTIINLPYMFCNNFSCQMIDRWQSEGVVQYLSEFLQTFRIVYWLEKLTWDVYVIILYICIFLIFLVIIDFLYVSISFKHKRYSFMQPIQLLRVALILITTILYVPINGKNTSFYCLQFPNHLHTYDYWFLFDNKRFIQNFFFRFLLAPQTLRLALFRTTHLLLWSALAPFTSSMQPSRTQ